MSRGDSTALPRRLVILGVLVAVAVFLTTQVKFEKEMRWEWPQGEARINAYLGLQRLLRAQGVESERLLVLDPNTFEGTDLDTVVLVGGAETEPAQEWLLDWVYDQGGHLVLLPERMPEWLAEGLGIGVVDTESAVDEELEVLEGALAERVLSQLPADDDTPPWLIAPSEPVLLSNGLPVELVTSQRLVLSEPPLETIEADGDAIAARYVYGLGMITVASEFVPLRNGYLARASNAAYAATLLAPALSEGMVWFVLAIEHTPLWQLILRHGWHVCLALALGLLLLLWRFWPRFGPPIADRISPRRSLAEHVSASGQYLWRSGEANELVQAMRESVRRAIGERTGPVSGTLGQQVARLGLEPRSQLRLLRALEQPQDGTQKTFIETVQVLQQAKKELCKKNP